VARAKLAVGDSWYAEGGSAAMIQAENEYKDFQTFFPNMPEAAEAQLKIANIHYREMEKPDRDYTHALRAEEEYRQLIIQYPENKLVSEAKQRLLEVQELLAEREFRIGKFYSTRESWAAAVARLKSLTDTYPLYSGADEALFLLGSSYEREADGFRKVAGLPEAIKGKMVKQAEDNAANAYERILTRYPLMPRAGDAKKQLEAMQRPVPTATPEALALNKKEQESRGEAGMWGRMMGNLHRGPDTTTAVATKIGDPTLVDPPQTSAPLLINQANEQMVNMAKAASGGGGKVTLEPVKGGAPPPNQPIPRSDSNNTPDPNAIPELRPLQNPNDSTGATEGQTAPPIQVNEVNNPAQKSADDNAQSSSSSQAQGQTSDEKPNYSTSKKKQKKGLRKMVPF
jgi:outer membrane protein assembly factor BamD